MDSLKLVRIKNEFNKVHEAIQESTLQNLYVEVSIKNNCKDYTKWNCVIYGREGTIWEGGQFRGTLMFPENYPIQSPEYTWEGIDKQKFYHMNVYPTGKTCIDMLNDKYQYKATRSVIEILTALERLLYDPNPMSPTDLCQAALYQFYYSKYERKVRQFVKDYMQYQSQT